MLVRLLGAERRSTPELAFLRMGLPRAAREYLLGKVLSLQLLATGLSRDEAGQLRSLCEGAEHHPFVVAHEREGAWAAYLTGREEQVQRLSHALVGTPSGSALATGLRRALRALEPPEPLTLGAGREPLTWRFEGRPRVMGVVNVTPDSFSDGGRFLSLDAALAQAQALLDAGADVLDIGGESTRPGALPVPLDVELARVIPVLEALRARTQVPLSVDTRKAGVADAALRAGAVLINDISALTHDGRMAEVIARHGAAVCLMHMQGTPETMQASPRYDDVIEDVLTFLDVRIQEAVRAGIPEARVLVDPGIGFGKTRAQQWLLLNQAAELRVLGRPLMMGTSRKSFLGALLGGKPASERLSASLGTVAALAAMNGADVVRVHDVAETRDVLTVVQAMRAAREGGRLYASPGQDETE